MRNEGTGGELFCDLETERFRLRRLGRVEAFRLTATWRRDPELMEGLTLSPRPRSLLYWWFRGPRSDRRTRFAHAIVPKAGGEPIGVHFVVCRPGKAAYFHIGLADRAWWGRNVVTEVRARLIGHFFAHGVERFAATIDAGNAASIFNYRRLGFRVTGPSTVGSRKLRRPAVKLELRREDWHAAQDREPHDRS